MAGSAWKRGTERFGYTTLDRVTQRSTIYFKDSHAAHAIPIFSFSFPGDKTYKRCGFCDVEIMLKNGQATQVRQGLAGARHHVTLALISHDQWWPGLWNGTKAKPRTRSTTTRHLHHSLWLLHCPHEQLTLIPPSHAALPRPVILFIFILLPVSPLYFQNKDGMMDDGLPDFLASRAESCLEKGKMTTGTRAAYSVNSNLN